MKKFGFTLVELLVVIAIVAIMAAIMFPVFVSAREKAHQTACASNMRQLAAAALQYATDWGAYGPPANGRIPDWAGGWFVQDGFWMNHKVVPQQGAYWPYVRNLTTYVCPAHREDKVGYGLDHRVLPMTRFPGETTLFDETCGGSTVAGGFSSNDPHFSGRNVAYADGHVKWHSAETSLARLQPPS